MKTKLSILIFLTLSFFSQSKADCPDATISPMNPTVCGAGKGITFTASDGDSYQWKKSGQTIKGATDQTYFTVHAGIYTVEVTTAGCGTSASPESNFVKHANPKAEVSVDGNPSFCKGESATINSTVSNVANPLYQWYNGNLKVIGETSSSLVVTRTGEYKLRVVDADFGCLSFSSPQILNSLSLFAQIAPPISPTFCKNGGSVILEKFSNDGFGSTYQWSRNGEDIPGATDKNYEVVAQGVYRVTINTILGCTATSQKLQILAVNCRMDGVSEVNNNISVYPNPTSGIVNISNESAIISKIEIFDVLGKKVLADTYKNQLDISQLPNGIYFLKLLDENNNLQSVSKVQKVH